MLLVHTDEEINTAREYPAKQSAAAMVLIVRGAGFSSLSRSASLRCKDQHRTQLELRHYPNYPAEGHQTGSLTIIQPTPSLRMFEICDSHLPEHPTEGGCRFQSLHVAVRKHRNSLGRQGSLVLQPKFAWKNRINFLIKTILA